MKKPFWRIVKQSMNGLFYSLALLSFLLLTCPSPVRAADGATEALELRYQAELAIAQEQETGNPLLAEAMLQSLPELLQDYLVTRDGTVALDTVDAAYVQEQFKLARAMEEPGVALALDVFSGPGTGFENDLRTAIGNLSDFHEKTAERLSEAALEVHERTMDRQLDKIERQLAKAEEAADKFDSKLEAKLDAHAERLAEKAERLEAKVEKAQERAEEKAEKTAEKAEQKAEKQAEKEAEKAEKQAEKAEEKAEKQAEKAEEKAEKQAEKADEKEEKEDKKDK